jgi:protein-L-isoaspartate(D-aspartate) O-methyltransferase
MLDIELVGHSMKDALIKSLQQEGITDPAVLAALKKVPREKFVHPDFEKHAYENIPLPIGHQQTISQPYIVAYMTQQLVQEPMPEKILEIGTGSGYQTAILASIFDEIWTIERIPALCERSKKTLQELHFKNVHFKCADGSQGWEEWAPFDAIIVTAAAVSPPIELLNQLSSANGKLLIPLGNENEVQKLTLITRHGKDYQEEFLDEVIFVPLIAN